MNKMTPMPRTNRNSKADAGPKTCEPSKPNCSGTGSDGGASPTNASPQPSERLAHGGTPTAFQESIRNLLDLYCDPKLLPPLGMGPMLPEPLKRQPYDELYLKLKYDRDYFRE